MSQSRNRDTEETLHYHAATKHSFWSVRRDSHLLDWENRPLLFKQYPTLPTTPLPRELSPPALDALSAVSSFDSRQSATLTLDLLAKTLYFCAGLTKKKVYPGGEQHHFRAAACTGALYEVELYVVGGDLPGLPAGIYHFAPADFALRRLRVGDFRGELILAAAHEPAVSRASVTLALTAIYWRNAWKYRARAYRHFYWNAGTILANLLATAVSEGLPAQVALGFLDDRIDRLLGIDGAREASLCLVALGTNGPPAGPSEIEPITHETVPLSRVEVDYPQIRGMRAASVLTSQEEVRGWRAAFATPPAAPPRGARYPLAPAPGGAAAGPALGDVILRRGSTRRFARATISLEHLSEILDRSTRGIPADFLRGPGTSLLDLYLVVHAVEHLPSGAYHFSPSGRALDQLKAGTFRREAGYLCLEQELGAEASVVVFFFADLARILEQLGNRGYAAAQLEAGILGGKMYLCAYALGLGATGTTFYDDEVTKFFSPHAREKATMFAVALGRPSRVPGRVERLGPGVR
jgi:SagB-type dehydrogenase family enzyme